MARRVGRKTLVILESDLRAWLEGMPNWRADFVTPETTSAFTATVARRMETARAAAGVTVAALAKDTGIRRDTLDSMLKGDRDFRVSNMMLVGKALKMDASQWVADLPTAA
ncbi:XRE family transcriptional regulator [Cryobacterium sp. MDB1-18-2]|uniref:helix-turn-helix domain-containing protein n=1 Tax=unclassified Cryobacterium TaxID=2649013 RepID=UPI0010695B40|nr:MULTISPECIES: helix-turn-helix transcriptional regulator [unclassified Cryobacterium]TFC26998.1 XRE family transcriptional regulator [Cryobacterium sp. MDB1-18-2]TFC44190.1 XRE family transcriptional regulator [Cryobacterium sp. MDB1-18-1]